MTTQLTLQTPIQLPPKEIPSYVDQLWAKDQPEKDGANTFCLLIWQPAWLEQELVRTGKINGPVLGTKSKKLINAARKLLIENKFPHETNPFDSKITNTLAKLEDKQEIEDLRGQNMDSSISALQPRRLITFAPKLDKDHPLETFVAAYCPLTEEISGDNACGDVIVLRGGLKALNEGLDISNQLLPKKLPSWLWWDGSLDESPELFSKLAAHQERLIIDSSNGCPSNCLHILEKRINSNQAVNDLNWLRLRNWRETLAMVFDPPIRRTDLENISSLDIDIQGNHPVQGILLAAWIADRLNWKISKAKFIEKDIMETKFNDQNQKEITFRLHFLPIGLPSIHPGQIIGLRLICKSNKNNNNDKCIILASESSECMRLEAGGMASMELIEEVVPLEDISIEKDVARLLRTSRGSTSPLLSRAAPIASNILKSAKTSK